MKEVQKAAMAEVEMIKKMPQPAKGIATVPARKLAVVDPAISNYFNEEDA